MFKDFVDPSNSCSIFTNSSGEIISKTSFVDCEEMGGYEVSVNNVPRTLTNIGPFNAQNNVYYYKANIGNAENLDIDDTIYTNASLTTTLAAGTYYQMGSSSTTTHCNNSESMTVVVDANGVITNISCALP